MIIIQIEEIGRWSGLLDQIDNPRSIINISLYVAKGNMDDRKLVLVNMLSYWLMLIKNVYIFPFVVVIFTLLLVFMATFNVGYPYIPDDKLFLDSWLKHWLNHQNLNILLHNIYKASTKPGHMYYVTGYLFEFSFHKFCIWKNTYFLLKYFLQHL